MIRRRGWRCSPRVVVHVDRMPRSPAVRYSADRPLRSGGPLVLHFGEAQGAGAGRGISQKPGIAMKGLKESCVDPRIQHLSGLMQDTDQDLLWLTQECDELVRIVGKVIANK